MGEKKDLGNYRQVSVPQFLGKMMEPLIVETTFRHTKSKGVISSSHLMTFYDEVTGVEMRGEQWMLSVLTLVGLLTLSATRST